MIHLFRVNNKVISEYYDTVIANKELQIID